MGLSIGCLAASMLPNPRRPPHSIFFKARQQLCAALGILNGAVASPDLVATELDLFGDFFCDAASGDSIANAFTLIEFEDAKPYSVFSKLKKDKTLKTWSRRFEHGFSQLVDWAWRLSSESGSAAARRIFQNDEPSIHFLLIAGRDADLTRDDLNRMRWRARNLALGGYKMDCFTFDGALMTLRRRLLYAAQT
jgi:hypothetical protein